MSIQSVPAILYSPLSDGPDAAEKTEIIAKVQQCFNEVMQCPMNIERILASFNSCHHLLEGLYLGNYRSFVESTDLVLQHKGSTDCEQHTNKNGFRVVITVCPMRAVSSDYPHLETQLVAESFERCQIEWVQVGRTIFDEAEAWLPLVHDCTFPDSEEARTEIPKAGMTVGELRALNAIKGGKIGSTSVQEWFRPTFERMDLAFFHNQRVLVHCHGGVSRSATVAIAYLISRLHRTTDEALSFLRKRRPCVDPRFLEGLQAYEQALAVAQVTTTSKDREDQPQDPI